MENQFTDYETSKMLKELGFNEKCFGYFSNLDNSLRQGHYGDPLNDTILNAPLWQQAEEWLWKLYVINISIKRIEGYKYSWSVYNGGQGLIANEAGRCEKTPILAKQKAILETIKYFHSQTAVAVPPKENTK